MRDNIDFDYLDSCYLPPSLWTGREDAPKGRLFQHVQLLDCRDLPEKSFNENIQNIVFLGFACDEGVRRNLGRTGAVKGPESLRKALRNVPLSPEGNKLFWDAGTIQCINHDLEAAQKILGEVVAQLRELGSFVIVLGGGHEVAWGHFQGLMHSKSLCSEGLSVLNFDAHFDLRPLLPDQKGSSGTGFRQMYEYTKEKNIPWNYGCLGVQPFGNTNALFDYAASINTFSCLAENMVNQPESVHQLLSQWMRSAKNIYLTLCLDVFGSAYAPGVSAPQPMGLSPQVLLPFFRQVLESGKVVGFDVAELNPDYERDDQTAGLGAYFIAEVLEKSLFCKAPPSRSPLFEGGLGGILKGESNVG